MNCPNCNAVLVPGQTQCGVCGTVFGTPTAPQNAPTAPTQPTAPVAQSAPYAPLSAIQPAYQPSAKDRGLSKAKFLKTEASKGTKTKALTAWILFAVMSIFIIANTVLIFSTPVYDIPVIEVLAGEEGTEDLENELDSLSAEVEFVAEEFEELADEYEDEGELDSAEIKAIEKFFEQTQELTDNATAISVITTLAAYEELYDELPDDLRSEIGIDSLDIDDLSEIREIIDIIVLVMVGFGVFLILLGLLGAAFKLTAMPVLVLLFYWPLTLALTGLIPTAILFVICIAFAVMCSGFNKEFKAVKQGIAQPASAPYSYQ